MTIPGGTSTGSKRPGLLFGPDAPGVPQRMESAAGCTVTADGRDYLDFIMALGAVALGYGHPAVTAAVIDAVERGSVGPLPPGDEELLAQELHAAVPCLDAVRFLKTGAEAVAAAVRIARTATARERVLGCGYHGWLDWCSDAAGVPASTRASFSQIRFNDSAHAIETIRAHGDTLACIVIEPVIDTSPTLEWLQTLRAEADRAGAVLIFDEVKTAFRIATGGATERWGVAPDLLVIGKALANGFPLAAVGGRDAIMRHAAATWISSTLATEYVSLAAARATLQVMRTGHVIDHLDARGTQLIEGLRQIASRHHALGLSVRGVPTMCYLHAPDDATSYRIAAGSARRGLLFKRTAYNFVSLAHTEHDVARALTILDEVLSDAD